VSAVGGEITAANNFKDVFVEVKESKEKILILASSPHPDVSALSEAISSNGNYEVKTEMAEHFDGKISDYQLVILHQLPSADHPSTVSVNEIKRLHVPVLCILGEQSDFKALASLLPDYKIENTLAKQNDVFPEMNSDFSVFTLSDETKNVVKQFPPLKVPFAEYRGAANGSSLLYQKIGSVTTDEPLLFFSAGNEDKYAVLCGEGLWQWRMQNYYLSENFDAFNEVVNKTVQHLVTHETKSRFKVVVKNSIPENEPVSADAFVYNDNYELITEPEVSISLTNSSGKIFPFTFSKTERVYSLDAGFFAPDNYKYKASAKVGDKLYTAEGEFNVSAIQAELNETVANHQLLYAWAHKTGGELFYPEQLKILSKLLLSREDIKTVTYSEKKFLDVMNLKWVFFMLLAFLSLEWFMRKRNGLY
jgi:hypothetical protein